MGCSRVVTKTRIPARVVILPLLALAVAIAVNAASAEPTWPGPLDLIREHPWESVLVLCVLSVVAEAASIRRARSEHGMPSVRETILTPEECVAIRRDLISEVRRTWIDGVLRRDLTGLVRVELGLEQRPDAVRSLWDLTVEGSDVRSAYTVREAYDELLGKLLILGAPGAGKTTALLELARGLLDEAEADQSLRAPIVLHLSTWRGEVSFKDWLAVELNARYGVPPAVARDWVERDRLALLLDGLDEVAAGDRLACLEAVNEFRSVHGQAPVVICSRSGDYDALVAKLKLNGAVALKPLTHEQVRDWLVAAGPALSGLREAMKADDDLWALLETPLMLSIAALAYSDVPVGMVSALSGAADGRQRLLDAYLARRLRLKRAGTAPADPLESEQWLRRLAEQMQSHGETVLYPDRLQPDWLPRERQRLLITVGLKRAVGAMVASVAGLVGVLAVGVNVGIATAAVAYIYAADATGYDRIELTGRVRWSWRALRDTPLPFETALIAGAAAALVGGTVSGAVVFVCVIVGDRVLAALAVRPVAPEDTLGATRQTATIFGLAAMPAAGVAAAVALGLWIGPVAGVVAGAAGALIAGVANALRHGGAAYLRHRGLVWMLRREGVIPPDLASFLNDMDRRAIMRRAGGGYLFIHRLLREHLAPPLGGIVPLEEEPLAVAEPALALSEEAKIDELQQLIARYRRSPRSSPDVADALDARLADARELRSRRRRRFSRPTVDLARVHLDAVEADLLRLVPASALRTRLPHLLARVQQFLPLDDPRRRFMEEVVRMDREPGAGERETVIAAVWAASSAARRADVRRQTLRNAILLMAALEGVAVLFLIAVELLLPGSLSLCAGAVCPAGGGWQDVAIVALVGLTAAAVAATASFRSLPNAFITPLGFAAMVLKLPTGALTAVTGLIFLLHDLEPMDTSAQLLSAALVLGYAQQFLTRSIDAQVADMLDPYRSSIRWM